MNTVRALIIAGLASIFLNCSPATDAVAYELQVPGVVCSSTSAKARTAARRAPNVASVRADPGSHTVTVSLDDGSSDINAVIGALRDSGFRVTNRMQLSQ